MQTCSTPQVKNLVTYGMKIFITFNGSHPEDSLDLLGLGHVDGLTRNPFWDRLTRAQLQKSHPTWSMSWRV